MPIEELAKKSKADSEKVITRVVQSEQIESAETIEGKHFYDVIYKGQNMIGYFRRLYRDNSISEFMRLGIEIVRGLENIL